MLPFLPAKYGLPYIIEAGGPGKRSVLVLSYFSARLKGTNSCDGGIGEMKSLSPSPWLQGSELLTLTGLGTNPKCKSRSCRSWVMFPDRGHGGNGIYYKGLFTLLEIHQE